MFLSYWGNDGKSFYTGKGVGVCILDTGIYEHIDFAGRIWAFYDFLSLKDVLMTTTGTALMWQAWRAGDGTASMGKYRERHRDADHCPEGVNRYGNGSQEDVLRAIRWIRVLSAVPNSGGKHFRWHHLQFQKGSCTACGKRGAALG